MSKHKKTENATGQDDKPAPRWVRIVIIVLIMLALLFLMLSGGNNQTWYPGKPYNER